VVPRRKILHALCAGLLAIPLSARAQQPGRIWRVGFFYFGSRESALETGRYSAFIQGMRELGYEEGKQFVLVARYADGDDKRYPLIAAELVATKPDVIVSTATATHYALKQATAVIPIVVTTTFDPVREGYADTLARPGRNFTGTTSLLSEIFPKHVELLKTVLPKLSRVAVLWNPGNAAHPGLLKDAEAAARANSVRVTQVAASTTREIESAFATMARERAEALIIFGDGLFAQRLRQIGEQAIRYRLVSIYGTREYPEVGGFMSYGPDIPDNYRRAAGYVDKILKGAKPGDLPFQQPTRLYLTINRKTVKATGHAISQELLLRADRMIE
jgi:ABC-type uncharacterized transport system substrate-binding protein